MSGELHTGSLRADPDSGQRDRRLPYRPVVMTARTLKPAAGRAHESRVRSGSPQVLPLDLRDPRDVTRALVEGRSIGDVPPQNRRRFHITLGRDF